MVIDSALSGSSISWSLIQPDVSRLTRACSYDRAGFGWSDAGPRPRTAGRVADELRVLLDRGGVGPPFVLVGHSFGGLVMRIFAARYRSDVSGLVLVDPAHPEEMEARAAVASAQAALGGWAAATEGPFTLSLARRTMRLDGARLRGEGFTLSASGTAGLEATDEIDIEMAGVMDLARLPVPAPTRLAGDVEAKVQVGGTRRRPTAAG